MRIDDQRLAILESMNHERDLKHLKAIERKHDEKRLRALVEEDETRLRRTKALITHEEQNKLNEETRIKDVEAHMQFLKSALNII